MAEQGTYIYEWPMPSVTVDVALFHLENGQPTEILLIERGQDPYQGAWALPGGYIELHEELAVSAARELDEETGISVRPKDLVQVGAYGSVDRDPRGRTIGVAFTLGVDRANVEAIAGDDAASVRWCPIDDLPDLAFDHAQIIRDALA